MKNGRLTRGDVYRIEQMHTAGRTYVEISKRIGCKAETIQRVLNGDMESREIVMLANGEVKKSLFKHEVGRCAGCGCKVVQPCIACRIRRQQQHQQAADRLTAEDWEAVA